MAAPLQISAISTQYVAVPVTDLVNRLPADPTSYAVSFAFLANGTKPTASTVFYSGSWQADTGVAPWIAQCLVGPGGVVTLAAGNTYAVYVQVVASPEQPVFEAAGLLVVY